MPNMAIRHAVFRVVLETANFALPRIVANPVKQDAPQDEQATGVVFVQREINDWHTDVVQLVQIVRNAIHHG